MSICKSFKPNIDDKSEILILGSMPGIKSLEEQEYYAHPQNRFWKVLPAVFGECLPSTSPANAAWSFERLVREYAVIAETGE